MIIKLKVCYNNIGGNMTGKVTKRTPGAVIDVDGNISTMEESNYHRVFFRNIIKDKLGVVIDSDNIDELIRIMLKELGLAVYIGCTEGDRLYQGGFLFIDSLEKLTNEQLLAILALYSDLDYSYDVSIVSKGNEDELSLGEVYEEFINREDNKKNL